MTYKVRPGGLALGATLLCSMAASVHAQVAVRDADNGALRAPNAAEAKSLAPAATTTVRGVEQRRIGLITGTVNPQPVTHDNGAVEQELDASTLVYTVARRNADGTLTMECVTGEEAAEQAVHAAAGATAAKEHQHDVE